MGKHICWLSHMFLGRIFYWEMRAMRDTIYRDEAVEVVKKWFEKIKLNPDILIDSIISLPSADRPQGEWIERL